MDKLIITLEKEDPFEVINKGDLVEVNPETNKYRKCKERLSPYVIGVCSEEWEESREIPYNISGDNYSISNESQKSTVEVQIAGIVTLKTFGVTCIGDLLVSGENGLAEAVRYKNDWINLGKIIGKVIQVTENKDEYVVLLTNM